MGLCAVCDQRWAQIKGFRLVLIRSALMFVLQYQRLHDLLDCVGAVCCRVQTLSPLPHRGVHSSKPHANEATGLLCLAVDRKTTTYQVSELPAVFFLFFWKVESAAYCTFAMLTSKPEW